jgi:AcrR family transcriptional regulator
MGKRQSIIRTATALFARQGFDGTTTAQIALEGNFTEPLLYYHFRGKDDLFTHIIDTIFSTYFSRFDALPKETSTQFEKIKRLIAFHFQFVREMPEETLLVTSACPARLNDPTGTCTSHFRKARDIMIDYLCDCLRKGTNSGEFARVPAKETAAIIVAMLNGLLRQHSLKLSTPVAGEAVVVEFCRRSLLSRG